MLTKKKGDKVLTSKNLKTGQTPPRTKTTKEIKSSKL